jgi:hypothetical protein
MWGLSFDFGSGIADFGLIDRVKKPVFRGFKPSAQHRDKSASGGVANPLQAVFSVMEILFIEVVLKP